MKSAFAIGSRSLGSKDWPPSTSGMISSCLFVQYLALPRTFPSIQCTCLSCLSLDLSMTK